jgi:polysaccharide biosynthesis protein PelF
MRAGHLFLQCEPGICVHHDPDGPYTRLDAEEYHERQFQAFGMLSGDCWPQLGGDPSCLDIVGINYYMHNQSFYRGEQIDVDHPQYRPLSDILFENYARYGRPIVISETGIEGDRRAAWFDYVASEVMRARHRGVPVEGICLYPVCNHPGWDDDRLCPNGLMEHATDGVRRGVHTPLAQSLSALRRYVVEHPQAEAVLP